MPLLPTLALSLCRSSFLCFTKLSFLSWCHGVVDVVCLAYSLYVFAECLWDASSFSGVLQPLCSCFASSWCALVACHSVLAWWLEAGVGVVCPDVSRLHAVVPVLAVGDGVAFHALHDGELAEHPSWILDKPVFWF